MSRMQLFRFLLPLVLTIGYSSLTTAQANDSAELVEEGVEAYQTAIDATNRNERVQLFSRAEMIFARVASERVSSNDQSIPFSADVNPDLFLNWGNAALGAEHLGAAILAYRRALEMDPQNGPAKDNLLHARSLLPDWIPTPEDQVGFGSFFDGVRQLGKGQWRGIASILFLIAFALLAIYIRTNRTAFRNLAILAIGCWVAALGIGWIPSGAIETADAVVIADEASVRSADSINAPLRFPKPLLSGSEVKVLESRDQWIRVGLSDGREGWLKSSAIERVRG